jgi:16S rRNA (cytosine1402-N4)-methyltransferase
MSEKQNDEKQYHKSVLLHESVEALNLENATQDSVFVDATFGGGGHSRQILQLLRGGKLVAFDQDQDAARNLPSDENRLLFVPHNFRELKKMLRFHGIRQVDGILADLGVSSHQLDEGIRGFSYRFEAPLDMRMNQNDPKKAADLLNTYSAADLQRIFSEFGEVRNARTLAQAIVNARGNKQFRNISDLLQITDNLVIGERVRYLSQVFQALRMEVNQEIAALQDLLTQSLDVLKPNGRLAIITFHSIEDRLVKNFIKSGNFEGNLNTDFYGNIHRPFRIVTKKPIVPTTNEQTQNARSRSAKLRIAEKI